MYNKIVLVGRLCSDVELSEVAGGITLGKARLAVDRRFPRSDGSKATDFVNVVFWRATATFVANYSKKGDKLLVEGELNIDPYERDGVRREYVQVVAQRVAFC